MCQNSQSAAGKLKPRTSQIQGHLLNHNIWCLSSVL